MINTKKSIAVTLAVLVSFLVRTPARGSEMDELKATVQAMQKKHGRNAEEDRAFGGGESSVQTSGERFQGCPANQHNRDHGDEF